jgi:regulator of extracellular matrix RemA (YlzA/DUF370 family)
MERVEATRSISSRELWQAVPAHWRHLQVSHERLPVVLEERRRLQQCRRAVEALKDENSPGRAESLGADQSARIAEAHERLEQFLGEVFEVLESAKAPVTNPTDQGDGGSLGTRCYAPYVALVRLSSAIDLLLWTQKIRAKFLLDATKATRPSRCADGSSHTSDFLYFEVDQNSQNPLFTAECELPPPGSVIATPGQCMNASRVSTACEWRRSHQRLALNALMAADAAFSFHRFRQLELEPGLEQIWHVLLWALCKDAVSLPCNPTSAAVFSDILCQRHQRSLESLVRIQRWRVHFRDEALAWPPASATASLAFMLFDALRRASMDHDVGPQSASSLQDLISVMHLMRIIPGLGLRHRMSATNIWELLFIMICSENRIWSIRVPNTETSEDVKVESSITPVLCILFYEGLVRVAYQWHVAEVLSREAETQTDCKPLYLTDQCKQLAVQTLRAITFEGIHGEAYRRIFLTVSMQLLFELGQLPEPNERATLRAELLRELLETSGQNYSLFDDGVLVVPLDRTEGGTAERNSTSQHHTLRWAMSLQPVDEAITAQHTYIHLLAERAFVWRQQPRFGWVVLFLIHQIAMAAVEQDAYPGCLDSATRTLVQRYRQRFQVYRTRHQGPDAALYHAALPVLIQEPSDETSLFSADSGRQYVQVYAGDMAHVVLSAVRDGLNSVEIRTVGQDLWTETSSMVYHESGPCLPDMGI